MPFTAARVPNLPAVVCTFESHVDGVNDPAQAHATTLEMLTGETGILYRVLDFSQVDVNFGDVVMGMSSDPGFKDPRMETIMIGTHELVQLAAQSAAQAQYGGLNIKLFTSVAEAVAAVKAELASS